MCRSRSQCSWLVVIGFAVVGFAAPAHGGLNESLSNLVTKHLRKAAEKEIPVEVQNPSFKGTVSAVEPKKHLEVTIDDFRLANDTIRFSVHISARTKVAGELNEPGGKTDASAIIDINASCDVEISISAEGDQIFGKGVVSDLDADFKVLELTPANLDGGTGLMTTVVNTVFKAKKKKIVEDLNAQYEKFEIEIE